MRPFAKTIQADAQEENPDKIDILAICVSILKGCFSSINQAKLFPLDALS